MERKDKQGARQTHRADPGENPSADGEELTIRWLCYDEYPLSDPRESDPKSEERVMLDPEKVKAVREYLETQFPGSKVEDRYEPSSKSQVFRIDREGKLYLTAVRQAFLDDHGAGDIATALAGFHLIEHLRELAGEQVIVTNEGLAL
jgi:hypothetical protein